MGAAAGPDIVEDGLVLCLDAANERSYPGSGDTWYDLSGNNFNATLFNMNINNYNINDNGSLYFDGVNDYADIDSNLGPKLIENGEATETYWFKIPNTFIGSASAFTTLWIDTNYRPIGNFAGGSNTESISIYVSGNDYLRAYYEEGNWYYHDNEWHNLTYVWGANYNKVIVDNVNITDELRYANGSSNEGFNRVYNNPPSDIKLANRTKDFYFRDGYISVVGLYNRALSEAEIKQNFEATRSRYGI